MEKYTYIKLDISGYYIEFDEMFDPNLYNNLGDSYEDFINNKWVLLSDEQVSFHVEHPEANVKEVWDMELTPPHERTLEEAKEFKINEISLYDKSDSINSFSINGQDMWLTVEERQQLATQINVNEAVGREDMTKWFDGVSYTFTIAEWKQMLIALEIYAGDALNVTESHKAAVNELENIQDVDAYDYTIGYPTKLEF